MSWRARLAGIAIAGGLLEGCGGMSFACNGNPDPCCSDPDAPACAEERACEAEPTVACCANYDDGEGSVCQAPTCDPLADNDFDGAGPLVRTGSACGADPAIGCYGANFTVVLPDESGANPPDFRCDTPGPGGDGPRHGAPPNYDKTQGEPCAPGYAVGQFYTAAPPVGVQECFALCAPGEAYLGNPNAQQPNGLAPHRCNTQDAVGAFGTPASATDNGEHCVFAWRFSANSLGVQASSSNNTVGLCLDHTKLRYASQGDGVLDTPWPSCASQPLHAAAGSHVPDAVAMGCVSTTTAGLAIVPAVTGLPVVSIFGASAPAGAIMSR